MTNFTSSYGKKDATDASGYKWGVLVMDKSRLCFGDVFDSNDARPIHLKEAVAIINTIQLLFDDLKNYRVDAFVDNEALKCNIDLKVQYIATKDNPADKISHSLSLQECQLSEDKWNLIQSKSAFHLWHPDRNHFEKGSIGVFMPRWKAEETHKKTHEEVASISKRPFPEQMNWFEEKRRYNMLHLDDDECKLMRERKPKNNR
ncbi:hypothetical protein KUTeg_001003 [Tegillarca granosa]|uniref:RNase H type-1 domain-containing protein n=1 Tax=Tegillarca granosa TaxID=220873 RepID=A0ABQ9FYW5_TEGGR|nr:hypothetical protein KUTeg_001003 [Tegillarca granosa]